jgi:hydrogenase 3 maturation protease
LNEYLPEALKGVKRLAVLGVGSVLRGDDAAGTQVIENLAAARTPAKYPAVRLYAGETAPENFSGKIAAFRPTHLLIVDAADLGQAPGTIMDINPTEVGGPGFCSHLLPLKVMTDYLVSETGTAVVLLGIQYKDIGFDAPMTPEVREAVSEICETLQHVINELLS